MTCACATITPPAMTAIDRVQTAHERIAASAEPILPFVAPERAARIRPAMALTGRRLFAAHHAATEAKRPVVLKKTEAATVALETAVRAPSRQIGEFTRTC